MTSKILSEDNSKKYDEYMTSEQKKSLSNSVTKAFAFN